MLLWLSGGPALPSCADSHLLLGAAALGGDGPVFPEYSLSSAALVSHLERLQTARFELPPKLLLREDNAEPGPSLVPTVGFALVLRDIEPEEPSGLEHSPHFPEYLPLKRLLDSCHFTHGHALASSATRRDAASIAARVT